MPVDNMLTTAELSHKDYLRTLSTF